MTTETEYLLIKLMEECAEVQHACAKALRFGPESAAVLNETNSDLIQSELHDVGAVASMLEDLGILTLASKPGEFEERRDRIKRYMRRSREIGTLEDANGID